MGFMDEAYYGVSWMRLIMGFMDEVYYKVHG